MLAMGQEYIGKCSLSTHHPSCTGALVCAGSQYVYNVKLREPWLVLKFVLCMGAQPFIYQQNSAKLKK
jgi:hypothetical protein